MPNQRAVFESHVHLYKPQYKSTGVDELLISCINFWWAPTQLISIHKLLVQMSPIVQFHKGDKIIASYLYGRLQWLPFGSPL